MKVGLHAQILSRHCQACAVTVCECCSHLIAAHALLARTLSAGCPVLGAVSWQAHGDSHRHHSGHLMAPPGHLSGTLIALPAGCAAGRQQSLQPEVGTKFVPPKLVRTFMGESAYSAVRETLLQQQAAHMHQLSELHRLVGVQRQLTQQLSFGGGSSAGEGMHSWASSVAGPASSRGCVPLLGAGGSVHTVLSCPLYAAGNRSICSDPMGRGRQALCCVH